jgi:hypothetical protein
MAVMQNLIVLGLLFLAAIVTGIWLSRLGKPLNPALSGVHKFLALACVIFAAIRIYHAAKLIEPSTTHFAVIAVLAISMVALIASGSVLMVPKLASAAWLAVHRIATVSGAAAFVFTLRLFILN